jgi:hypothetical protein
VGEKQSPSEAKTQLNPSEAKTQLNPSEAKTQLKDPAIIYEGVEILPSDNK